MTVLVGIATFIGLVIALIFATGFVVMITAGMVHSEVASLSTVIMPWSFRESVFVGIGLSVLGGFFYGPTLTRKK